MNTRKRQVLRRVAAFYDRRKVGDSGPLGFRRSTDLGVLAACLEPLVDAGVVRPGRTLFLDLGCADGRLNVFFSYLSRCSAGIELDEWTLEEYAPLRSELDRALAREGLPLPPENIFLFHGDATDERVHQMLEQETGFPFESFDLFYTYLVMHEEFAALVAEKARKGARLMVYGLGKILPRYAGLRLLDISPLEGILAVYEKE